MKVQAIIPTAGLGLRFGSKGPKTLVDLKGKPIFIWSLMAIEQSGLVDSIVLVVNEKFVYEYQKIAAQYELKKINKIIAGGETRYDSVKNALAVLDDDTEFVVVHDGARPLIDTGLIDKAIELCKNEKAVILAVPVKQTIKKIDGFLYISETLDREEIWEVQTPQVFRRDLLVKAYETIIDKIPTDDSALVESLGVKVKVLKGDYKNIKITTKEDLSMAEALMN